MDLPRPPARSPAEGRAVEGQSGVFAVYGLVLSAAAIGIGGWRGHWDVYRVGDPPPEGARLLLGPLLGLVVALAVVFVSRLCVHQFDWARHLHRNFRGLLGNLRPSEILVLALASGIGEELLFRGALLPWIGLVPSTIIFGALHVAPRRGMWPWTMLSLIVGGMLGGMAVLTGDLGGPIVAHFLINYMNLSYIVRVELPG